MVNFSGALVANGWEYVGDSQEWTVAGGPFYCWPVVFTKTKTTKKVKPICNVTVNLVSFENISHNIPWKYCEA